MDAPHALCTTQSFPYEFVVLPCTGIGNPQHMQQSLAGIKNSHDIGGQRQRDSLLIDFVLLLPTSGRATAQPYRTQQTSREVWSRCSFLCRLEEDDLRHWS